MGSVSGMPPSPNSALPQTLKYQRCTSMHFGENQLSPALIGLSPLSTGHPNGFQPKLVRSSTASYRCFNLPMDRSTGFGSNACNSFALFRLGFPTASPIGLTSLHTITRRLIMQKARRHRGWSLLIPAGPHVSRSTRVQVKPLDHFDYGALTLSGRPSHAVLL